jgi:type VI protein secretion system component VasF
MTMKHQLKSREEAAREYLQRCAQRDIERKSEADRAIELLAWGICAGFVLILVLAFLT